ncbi:proteoglycan 4 [Rhinolophus ferrumequinum]|uniref:Proteoglycan 4 n=1 Tax=Rhinolophus ferrumequinum TaxID=59479 RepID=A0A7J7SYK8_RHIFE|nr:proteoglycan 4 [Rhinolophus ferrumequinum]
MERKILPIYLLLLLSVSLIQQVSSQDLSSCAGRCGEGYSRDTPCNCDYNCQHYMECCPDFKRVCTVELSCKGRCFESFERGRECDCDSQCKTYGKCCPDYEDFCEEVKENKKPAPKKKPTPEPPVADEAGSGLDNVIPGTDVIVSTPNQDMGINPMLSDETNLCNGKPVDGLTTLRNGTLVAFRGHYFWLLNPLSPPSPPRRITEVWGIPSPIDTVFTRCNCEGKTFFFKDSQYWRFTNDVQDAGYPKQIAKGFGGLNGKIVAALSIAKYKDRPESVYFFKRGGNVQQYTYKQEPVRKCTRRPAIHYPVFGETTQVRRRRFERAVGPSQTHTIRIQYTPVRVRYQDKGFLHNEAKVSYMWRGFPKVVTTAIALPNVRKPDGYDYYAFSKDQYYNVDVPRRTARAISTRSGQTLSSVWYKCP